MHRRGFPPSPPGRHDFDFDAADVACLLDGRPHVVAHSYGALGALIAATRMPARVRSLTLIEPPLFRLVPHDPEVRRLERIGNAALTDGLDADPVMLRSSYVSPGRRASIPLEVLRDARVPTLVASGGHTVALERICDAAAGALRGERIVAPGAGHCVAAAPGFAARLEQFLVSVD